MDPAGAVAVNAPPRRGGLDERRLDEALERAFPSVARKMGEFLIGQLLTAARELRLDYESVVLWGVMSMLGAADGPQDGAGSWAATDWPAAPGARRPRPVRIRDLAAATGIPRETVRRKLLRLEQEGRVERAPLGWRVVDRPDDPVLRRLARDALAGLRATASELDAALARALEADRSDDAGGAPGPGEPRPRA